MGWRDAKKLAASIRAYWMKYKGLTSEERWFRTLADDTAPPEKLSEAAQNIVRPVDETVIPSSMVFSEVITPTRKPGETPKMRGESLRTKRNPSVSQLLQKRMKDLAECCDQ
jgi:hypothetical protein